jgi:hypothetical protein
MVCRNHRRSPESGKEPSGRGGGRWPEVITQRDERHGVGEANILLDPDTKTGPARTATVWSLMQP